MDKIKEKIRDSLVKELKKKGGSTKYQLDLIDDYMMFWDIKNKLLADAKETPYTEWRNSETSFGRKKNDSVDQAVKVNGQMMKILQHLEINIAGEDVYDMEM